MARPHLKTQKYEQKRLGGGISWKNLSTGKAEIGLDLQGHLQIHSEFKACLVI